MPANCPAGVFVFARIGLLRAIILRALGERSLPHAAHTAGVVLAFLVFAFIFLDSVVMAVSPKRWFRLPGYLRFSWRASGRYERTATVHRNVRLLGIVLILAMGWLVVEY
jgi:hypothetical protein